MSVTQFKAKCLGVVEKVQKERCRVRILKYGKVAAVLVPAHEEEESPLWGRSRGETRISGDILKTGEVWTADV